MRLVKFLSVLLVMFLSNGCLLTKAVTVPMRVGGGIISVIPGAGNPAHNVIDGTADAVDKVPL